jgi:hypothetical protein
MCHSSRGNTGVPPEDTAREMGLEMRCHRPADDPPTPRIEDDGKVEETRPRRYGRDIRHPELIRRRRREVALHEIRRGMLVRPATRGVHAVSPAHAHQAAQRHHAGNTLLADVNAQVAQIVEQSGSSRGAPYVPSERAWHVRSGCKSTASCCARREGGRSRHA